MYCINYNVYCIMCIRRIVITNQLFKLWNEKLLFIDSRPFIELNIEGANLESHIIWREIRIRYPFCLVAVYRLVMIP